MICPKCGKQIRENSKFCPACGCNIESPKDGGKKKRKPGLMKPIISLVLSVVMLSGSAAGWVFSAYKPYEKASDKKTEGKIVSEIPTEARYDADNIEKTPVDLSEIEGIEPNEEGAEEVRKEIALIEEAIEQALVEVKAEYPNITKDTIREYINAVASAASELRSNDVIENYYKDDDNVLFDLKFGGYYLYAPHVEGYDSGEKLEIEISTYQPYYTTGQYDSCIEYRDYADNGAKLIDSNIEPYKFNIDGDRDADFNDDEVSVKNCASFGNYNVILWHGHGCYNYELGSLMCIGEKRTEETDAKYHELLMTGDMIYGTDTYFIGKNFVENRISDGSLEKSVIYIGTCSAGYNSDLADAFLAKGAEAVYAPSDSVYTIYNAKMIHSVSEGLTKKNSDGSLYSVSQALEYAKKTNGETDGDGTEIKLFTENEGFALDWYEDYVISDRDVVLVLDTSGSMDGTPIEETRKAAKKFVQTVLEQDSRVAVVTYENDAKVVSEFSTREAVLTGLIDSVESGGGTNIDAGLQKAEEMLDKSKANKKIIVLMSDGVPNDGRVGEQLIEYAGDIKKKEVYLYTLGFFTALGDGEKANAQKLMGDMASEGHHYEVANADDLVYFFEDIADTISGQKYIYIEIACPVNVKVSRGGETLDSDSDDLKTRTSFGVLSFEEIAEEEETESEEASEGENLKKILRLKDGMEYDIEIEGTGRGKMDYTISYMDENGDYTDKRTFKNIKIKKSTEIATVAASTRSTTVMNVDEDGDGKYDKIYKAQKNGKGKIANRIFEQILFYAMITCLAWMLVSILVVVIQVKRRKKYFATA